MVNAILAVVGIYFIIGFVALCILDILTGRIRSRLHSASEETQGRLAVTGSYVGNKTSIALTLIALWLFWPVAIYGALSSSKESKPNG